MPAAHELESWPEAGFEIGTAKWSKSAQGSVGRSLKKCLEGKGKDQDRDKKADKYREDEDHINKKRQDLHLEVTGSSQSSRSSPLPGPWGGFEEIRRLLPQLADANLGCLTPLQAQVIPLCLAGHDVLASAQPGVGSGKFLSILLPALVHVQYLDRSEAQPRALVLFPTRESSEAFRSAAGSVLKKANYDKISQPWVGCCTSGVIRKDQVRDLQTWTCHILAGTPNRLLDFARKKVISLEGVTFLAVAQANLMLAASLGDEVTLLQRAIRPQRQVLVLTSFVTPAVEDLCSNFHSEQGFVRVTAKLGRGETGGQNEGLTKSALGASQKIDIIDTLATSHVLRQKGMALLQRLEELGNVQALIFVKESSTAETLSRKLSAILDVKVGCIHKAKSQESRLFVVQCYVQKQLKYLVTTDVIYRGVELPNTKHVIVFDLGDMKDYMEQVNKARDYDGSLGYVLTFFELREDEKDDAARATKLKDFLEQRGQQPPQALLDVVGGVGAPRRVPRAAGGGGVKEGGRGGGGGGGGGEISKKERHRRGRRSGRQGSRSRSDRSNRKAEGGATTRRSGLKLSSRSPRRPRSTSPAKQGGEYSWSRNPGGRAAKEDASHRSKRHGKHSRKHQDQSDRHRKSSRRRKRTSPRHKKARVDENKEVEKAEVVSSTSSDSYDSSESESDSSSSAAGWDSDVELDGIDSDTTDTPPKPSAWPAEEEPKNPLNLNNNNNNNSIKSLSSPLPPPPAAPSSKAASRAALHPTTTTAAFISAEGLAMPRPKSGVVARAKAPSSPTSSVGSEGRRAPINNNHGAVPQPLPGVDLDGDNDKDVALAIFGQPPPLEARPKAAGWSIGSDPRPPPALQDRRTSRKAKKAKQDQEWQAKLDASQREKKVLEKQVAEMQQRLVEMQQSQDSLKQTVEAQQKELGQRNEQLEKSGQETRRLESECVRLRKAAQEKEDLQTRLQKERAKVESLSNYLETREKEMDAKEAQIQQRFDDADKVVRAADEKRKKVLELLAKQEHERDLLDADRRGLLKMQDDWEQERTHRQVGENSIGSTAGAGDDTSEVRALSQKLRATETEKAQLLQRVEQLSDTGFLHQEREEQLQMLEARVQEFEQQRTELELQAHTSKEYAAKLQQDLNALRAAKADHAQSTLPAAAAAAAASVPAAGATAATAVGVAAGAATARSIPQQPIDVDAEILPEAGKKRRRRRRPREEDNSVPHTASAALAALPAGAGPTLTAAADAAAPTAAGSAGLPASQPLPQQLQPRVHPASTSRPVPPHQLPPPRSTAPPIGFAASSSSSPRPPPPVQSLAADSHQPGIQLAVPTSKRGGAKRPAVAGALAAPPAAPTPKMSTAALAAAPGAAHRPLIATTRASKNKESDSSSSNSGSGGGGSSSSSDGDDPGGLF